MFDDSRKKDAIVYVRREIKKKLPYSIKDITDRSEVQKYNSEVEARSVLKRQAIRENAINLALAPEADARKYLGLDRPKPIAIKQSFFTKLKYKLLNFLTKLPF